MIAIRWKCGHTATVGDNVSVSPICACGERQITMANPRRMPRFTGTVRGPVAEYKALDPGTANLAPGGALKLKERG